MNQILSEKEYQAYLLNKLKTENGYIIRDSKHYNRLYAVDQDILIQFFDEHLAVLTFGGELAIMDH